MDRFRRIGGLIAMLAIALAILSPAWSAQSMSVAVLDVGQGDSILITLPSGGSVLVDAGDRDAGPAVIRALRERKIGALEMVVASHPHVDHIGGMADVLSAVSVRSFLDSGFASGSRTQVYLLRAIQSKRIAYKVARAGQKRVIGGATFEVLAPGDALLSGTDSDANNNSIVLKVSWKKVSFLLAGDIEPEGRARLGGDLSATVLKVAHHGSRNGTDSALVARVRPKIAVISVGAGNSYHHPHAEALAALAGTKLYRTDRNGTVVLKTDGVSVKVTTGR